MMDSQPQEAVIKQNGTEGSAKDGEQWPAVNSAYDFVLPSYQFVLTRFEAADTRLTALLTLSSTLTIAVPLFARNVRLNISFASPFFVLGMTLFLLGATVGIIGRATGSVALPDPMVMYKKSLHHSEWEFKKNEIYFAGRDFDLNVQTVRRKGNIALAVSIALLLEVLSFVAWVAWR